MMMWLCDDPPTFPHDDLPRSQTSGKTEKPHPNGSPYPLPAWNHQGCQGEIAVLSIRKKRGLLSAEHQGIDDRLDQRAKGHHETQDPPQFGHTDLIEPGQGLGASDSTYRPTSVRSYSWCLPSRKNYHELPSHSYDICIWTCVHTAHMWLHNIQTCIYAS
jgi:hypothetical protein